MEDRFYLLIRDRKSGQTQVTEFTDSDIAYREYVAAEVVARHRAGVEVVLIGGESEHAVRDMYPHYFSAGSQAERRKRLITNLLPT